MTAIRINDLTLLGLPDGPAIVYMRLLTDGPSDVITLAGLTGQTPSEARDALDILREAGLSEVAVEGIVGMAAVKFDGFTSEQPRSVLTTTSTSLAGWAITHLRPVL